jgi:hypothetical protein
LLRRATLSQTTAARRVNAASALSRFSVLYRNRGREQIGE